MSFNKVDGRSQGALLPVVVGVVNRQHSPIRRREALVLIKPYVEAHGLKKAKLENNISWAYKIAVTQGLVKKSHKNGYWAPKARR